MLDLRTLHYLITLADHAHYARAAEHLGISQPALTRAIQALERQINLRLFDRDRSGVTSTPQGTAFIEHARILVANARDLERQTALAVAGMSGHVRFGIAPMPARALLAQALRLQTASAPDLTYEVIVRNVGSLWPQLVAGDIEFFINAEGQVPQSPPVRVRNLGTFPYGVIVRADHPLLGSRTIQRFPLFVSSGMVLHVPELLRDNVCLPPNVVEDLETIAAITASTDAIWICSPVAAKDELASGTLRSLHLASEQAINMRITMYSLDRRSQSPAARSLQGIFQGLIKDII